MKIDFVKTLIAFAVSALITYGLFSISENENKLLLSYGSFIFLAITLALTISVNFKFPRATTNIRVVSGIFFIIALVSNIIFSFFHFSIPSYIIINGILLLIYVLLVYSINKAKQ